MPELPIDIQKLSDDKLLMYLQVFEQFRDDYIAQMKKLKEKIAENNEHLATLSIEARLRGILEASNDHAE